MSPAFFEDWQTTHPEICVSNLLGKAEPTELQCKFGTDLIQEALEHCKTLSLLNVGPHRQERLTKSETACAARVTQVPVARKSSRGVRLVSLLNSSLFCMLCFCNTIDRLLMGYAMIRLLSHREPDRTHKRNLEARPKSLKYPTCCTEPFHHRRCQIHLSV